MSVNHSYVISETCCKDAASITVIVQSDDHNLKRIIHELCNSAIKRAVRPLDAAREAKD